MTLYTPTRVDLIYMDVQQVTQFVMARGNTIASAFEHLVKKAHYELTIIIIIKPKKQFTWIYFSL